MPDGKQPAHLHGPRQDLNRQRRLLDKASEKKDFLKDRKDMAAKVAQLDWNCGYLLRCRVRNKNQGKNKTLPRQWRALGIFEKHRVEIWGRQRAGIILTSARAPASTGEAYKARA